MSDGPKKAISKITKGFSKHGYICSDQISTAVYLASELEKPILIEGPPGVGKTELANTAAMYFKKEFLLSEVRRNQMSLIGDLSFLEFKTVMKLLR